MMPVIDFRAQMARRMTEKELLEHVRAAAKQFGWLTYHTHRSDRSEPGYPDLHLVRGTRSLFVELKTEKGRTTPAQDVWIEALRATHVDVVVWRPRHWISGDIITTLKAAA